MNIMTEFTNILTGAILPAFYLLYQLPLLLASGLLARRFRPHNWFEFFAVAGFLYVLFMTAVPAILGSAGLLTAGSAFVAAWVAGAAVLAVERERPRLKLPPLRLSLPELALLALLCGFLGYQWRAYGYLSAIGTDAMIYHLYYPAVWIATGTVERLTQPGFVTSSYPCYGELIYAWQMVSAGTDFFAKNYQFFFLLLGVFAAISGALAVGFRRMSAIGAGLFVAFTGVVFRNATVANTDIVTGTFLLIGLVFLVTGARRNRPGWFLLAGAGFGMAAGTKYLGLMLAPPALLAAGAAVWFLRPACRRNLLWCISAAAVTASPCFIANWIVAGNPFFPARIGIGEWVLFPNYLDLHAPAIGWSRRAWAFFVNADSNSLHLPNALLLLVFLAAALTGWIGTKRFGRRPFRVKAATVLGAIIVVLLAIQLRVYPSMTQPRQIIPLAMLAAVCGAVPLERLRRFRFFRSGRGMAAVIAALLYLASYRQLHYPTHGLAMLLHYAIGGAILFGFFRSRSRILRIGIAAGTAVFLLLDAGYRFGASQAIASSIRSQFVSPANEEVRQLLDQSATRLGLRIAYCGAYYYNFIGSEGGNTLLSIPVTASGKSDPWDYHSFEEMRIPGSYETWLERLRTAGADFLLVDLRTFPAPEPRIELDWANAHPEEFIRRFDADGLTLFELRRRP